MKIIFQNEFNIYLELKGRSNGIHSISKYTALQFILYLPFEQMNLKLQYRWKYTERCVCMGKDLVHYAMPAAQGDCW